MDLISIIVPVYRAEKYLDRCVESIVNQTYRNFEIILVDDGSPDKCPSMCDVWAEKDCRIKVLHKTNGGSAQARNVALDIAKGDYIAFVDSDDMMNRDMLTILHNVAVEQKADIVECGYSIEENRALKQISDIAEVCVYDTQSAMLEHLNDRIFRQVIWNKLYRTETIGEIRFVERKVIDDEFWTYRVIGNAVKLVHINDELYFYRQQEDSVMHQCYSLKRLVSVEAHVERHEFIRNRFPELYERSLVQLWFDCRYHGQMAFLNLNDKDIKEVFSYLQSIMKDYPLSYKFILHQETKELVWLMIEKLSLKLVCKLRNIMQKGL